MKAIRFEGHFDYTSMKQILSDIDKVDKDEQIILYLVSGGGGVSETEILADYINREPERFEIVCVWEMSSAAFDLLIRADCKVTIKDGALAKIHLFTNDVSVRELGDTKSEANYMVRDIKRCSDVMIKNFKKAGFTKTEINRIQQGETIICDAKRMRHMLKVCKGMWN